MRATFSTHQLIPLFHSFFNLTFGGQKCHIFPMTFPDWFFPKKILAFDTGNFSQLRAEQILLTIDKLEARIGERFPESGLRRVCQEFRQLAESSEGLARRLGEPIWPVRVATFLAVGLLVLVAVGAVNLLFQKFSADGLGSFSELLQTTEAAINELIFLGLALFFLTGLEMRLKRQAALKALHQLRSIAHVVDMHQLTKDPAMLLSSAPPTLRETAQSPERVFSTFELARYLDYCSEMLALIAKIAALFAQTMDDPIVLTAVNELESLTQGLSGKIWQKIMILDLAVGQE